MSTETGLLILSGIIGLIAVSMLKPSSKPYFGLLTKNKDGSISMKLSPAKRKKGKRRRK